MAFPTGWLSKSALVIQHSKVTADQTAFPVLITEACFATNCPEILTTGNAHAAQSDGGDLRFSTDSAGATQIACEVVTWSQNATFANARAEIYVPRDILTASDVTIYVWWEAGGGLSQPAANASFGSQAVWNSNYLAVYHLNEATNAQALDSTSNALSSTSNVSTQVAAQIGNGQSFTAGSSQWLALPIFQPGTTWTVSSWVKVGAGVTFVVLEMRQASGFGSVVYINGSNNKATMFNTNGAGESVASTATAADSTWHYVAYTSSFVSHIGIVYVDNNAGVSGSFLPDRSATANGRVARDAFGTFLTGQSDELRVSSVVLSSTWIATEYNNQSSPGTFVIAGTRSSTGTPDVTALVSDTLSFSDLELVGRAFIVSDTLSFSDLVGFTAGTILGFLENDFINIRDSALTSFAVQPPAHRGNIDYDQIRVSARSADGNKFLMLKGSFTAGHVIVFDADGNAVDSGHT